MGSLKTISRDISKKKRLAPLLACTEPLRSVNCKKASFPRLAVSGLENTLLPSLEFHSKSGKHSDSTPTSESQSTDSPVTLETRPVALNLTRLYTTLPSALNGWGDARPRKGLAGRSWARLALLLSEYLAEFR